MKNSRDGKSYSTNLAYTPPEYLRNGKSTCVFSIDYYSINIRLKFIVFALKFLEAKMDLSVVNFVL